MVCEHIVAPSIGGDLRKPLAAGGVAKCRAVCTVPTQKHASRVRLYQSDFRMLICAQPKPSMRDNSSGCGSRGVTEPLVTLNYKRRHAAHYIGVLDAQQQSEHSLQQRLQVMI